MGNTRATKARETGADGGESRQPATPVSPTVRSAIANGSRLHTSGVDGRSAEARRWRDLYVALLAELPLPPTEAQRQLVRRATSLAVLAEQMEAQLAQGGMPNPFAFVRLCGALSRCLIALGLETEGKLPEPPTLADLLAKGGKQ